MGNSYGFVMTVLCVILILFLVVSIYKSEVAQNLCEKYGGKVLEVWAPQFSSPGQVEVVCYIPESCSSHACSYPRKVELIVVKNY